jgi:hypothetical protein
MGEATPLGSTRIVTLPVTEHQILSAALSNAAAGLEVYPIYSADDQGVRTCSKRKRCEDPGKLPKTPHGFSDVSPDPERIAELFPRWPGGNIDLSGYK